MPLTAAKQAESSSEQTTSPTDDLNRTDIIPGRLTQAKWMDVLRQEDADETVAEIMEELLSRVMEGCLKVQIKIQLLPFSASWAIKYLKQIVVQQFTFLDEERSVKASEEESEPMTGAPEVWTQGFVPVINDTTTTQPQPSSKQKGDLHRTPVRKAPKANQICETVARINRGKKPCKRERKPQRRNQVHVPYPSPKCLQQEMQQINLASKKLPDGSMSTLSCSAKEMDVGAEYKNKTQDFDHSLGSLNRHKYHRPISKLDPLSFPTHNILPQYEILDDTSTKSNSKKPRGLSTLEQIHKRRQTDGIVTSLNPANILKVQSGRMDKVSPSRYSVEEMASCGPRLDKMKLAKGVARHLDPQPIDINPFSINAPTVYQAEDDDDDKAVPQSSSHQIHSLNNLL